MGWKISYGGREVTDEDATVGEYAAVLEVIHRPGWELMLPNHSPDTLAAWCIVAIMRGGVPITEALLQINQQPVAKLMMAYSEREPTTNGEPTQADLDAMQHRLDLMRAAQANSTES